MKALSMWQPWASAIAVGSKRIETRGWSTRYRGPLAIHAAKRRDEAELLEIHRDWKWVGALTPIGWNTDIGIAELLNIDLLPFGSIVAVAELVDCQPTGFFAQVDLNRERTPDRASGHLYKWTEGDLGNFSPGRFGFVLADVERLAEPIPYRGRQGLFDIDPSVIRLDHTRRA